MFFIRNKCIFINNVTFINHYLDNVLFFYMISKQRVGTQYAEILLYRTLTLTFTLKRCNFHHETQIT